MSYKSGAQYIVLDSGDVIVKSVESTSGVTVYKRICGTYIDTIVREYDDQEDSVIDALYELRHGIGKIRENLTKEEIDEIFVSNGIPERFRAQ